MRSLVVALLATATVAAAYTVPKEIPESQPSARNVLEATKPLVDSNGNSPELALSGTGILESSWSSLKEPEGGVPKAEEPIILAPISSKDGAELALLLVPGAYINAAAYQPLGEAIQAASPLRLWVGLVRPFALDLPNPAQCGDDIELTLQMMIDQGMNASTTVVVAGHSLGGVVMQEWIFSNLPAMTGMILMASELNRDLATVTLPVLHISGDLDGMVRVPEVEPVFRDLEELVQTDPISSVTKPVVILQDLNHMLFASGEPPTAVLQYDILSPVTEEEGHAVYALHMSAFITAATGAPQDQLDEARAILETDFIDTKEILRPLAEIRELTGGATSSPWAAEAQSILSNVDPGFSDSVVVNDTSFSDLAEFEAHQPVIEGVGETAVVNTYSSVTYPAIIGVEHMLSAEELAIKLKRQEAVAEVLAPFGVPFLNESKTCRDINEAAVTTALSFASDHVRERYYSRGRQIALLEDDPQVSGPQWLESSVTYNDTDDLVVVQSSSLVTALGVPFGFDGMYYCKLMPPSRALEYIMVDSLRGTQPVVVDKRKPISSRLSELESTLTGKRLNILQASNKQSQKLDSTLAKKRLNVHERPEKSHQEKFVGSQKSVEAAAPPSHHAIGSSYDEKIHFVQPHHSKPQFVESLFNVKHEKDRAKHATEQTKSAQKKGISHGRDIGEVEKNVNAQEDKLVVSYKALQAGIRRGDGLGKFQAIVREVHQEKHHKDDDEDEHEEKKDAVSKANHDDKAAPTHPEYWYHNAMKGLENVLKGTNFMKRPETLRKTEESISERMAERLTTNVDMERTMTSGIELLFPRGIMSHIVSKLAENTEEYMKPLFAMGKSLGKHVSDEEDYHNDRHND